MLVAILDTETTGLDLTNDKIIEVAIVVYNTDVSRQVLTYSALVNHPGIYVPQDVSRINGITTDMSQRDGCIAKSVCDVVAELLSSVDIVVAHNGNAFDRPLVEKMLKDNSVEIPTTAWIDSKIDITYPSHVKTRKLLHLCAEMGIQIRPGHEALNDCLMLLDLLVKLNQWQDMSSIVMSRHNKVKIS